MLSDQAFADGMMALALVDPDRAPQDDVSVGLWRSFVDRLDDQTFLLAARRWAETGKWYPKPAELLELAEQVLADHGLMPLGADQAWGTVAKALTRWPIVKPQWSAEIQRAIDDAGGMAALAGMDTDGLGYARHRFVASYGEYRRRRVLGDGGLLAQALPMGANPYGAVNGGTGNGRAAIGRGIDHGGVSRAAGSESDQAWERGEYTG